MTPVHWIGGALAGIGLLALLAAAAATLWEVVRPNRARYHASPPWARPPRHIPMPGTTASQRQAAPAGGLNHRPPVRTGGQENAAKRPAGVLGGGRK